MRTATKTWNPVALLGLAFATNVLAAPATPDELTFVELQGPYGGIGVIVSPDGAHVYTSGSTVAAYARDPVSGALDFIEVEQNGVEGVSGLVIAYDLALSPDGAHLYVVAQNNPAMGQSPAILTFTRDPSDGTLAFADVLTGSTFGLPGLDGVISVAVSPDGAYVYTAGDDGQSFDLNDGVVTFSRNQETGALTFVSHLTMLGASGITLGPDGAHVYVSDEDEVVGHTLDPTTNALDGFTFAFLPTPLSRYVTPSPDGRNLYVTTASAPHAIAVLNRNSGGFIGFRESHGLFGTPGISGAVRAAVSPDGERVYVVGFQDNALSVFAREPTTGPSPTSSRRSTASTASSSSAASR